MSTAASTAVLIISAIRTKAIESSSTISSILETSTARAAISTATAMRKWIRMFRCVRSTWMIPSKATLKLSMIEGGRRPGAGSSCRLEDRALARSISSPCSSPSRCRIPWTSGQRHSSPTTWGQITTSPSARGTPSGSSSRPSIGNESTSVASSIPRCSALSARISSGATNAIPSSAAATPSSASACRARSTAAAASTATPLRFSTSTSITSCGRCRSLRRGACTPRRSAARACAGRRPRGRTRRRRSRRPRAGCRAPGSGPMPARGEGRSA